MAKFPQSVVNDGIADHQGSSIVEALTVPSMKLPRLGNSESGADTTNMLQVPQIIQSYAKLYSDKLYTQWLLIFASVFAGNNNNDTNNDENQQAIKLQYRIVQ